MHAGLVYMRALRVATIAVIVGVPMLLLAAYGIGGGMPWDFSLVALSEEYRGLAGFTAYGLLNPQRMYTNIFYHLAYLLDGFLGITGSWFGYHAVFALLLSVRGALVFWLARLLDLNVGLASAAAAIAVLHGSDTSIGHVGELNSFGMTLFVLLSMCLFLSFLKLAGVGRWLLLFGVTASSYLALWTHEASLFGLAAYPMAFTVMYRRFSDRTAAVGAVIATIPALGYGYVMADRLIFRPSGGSYQELVVRKDFGAVVTLGSDFLRLLRGLLWVPGWLADKVEDDRSWRTISAVFMTWSGLTAAILFLVYCALLARATKYQDRAASNRLTSVLLLFLACAFIVPYVALNDLGSQLYYRTQNLASPFAAILIAITVWAIARRVTAIRARVFGGSVFVILITGFAADALSYARYNRVWETVVRAPIARLLSTVPSVKPNTIIVVQGVPSRYQLQANFWFYQSLRLAYPYITVAGSYTYSAKDPKDYGREKVVLAQDGRTVRGEGRLYKIVGDKVELRPGTDYDPAIQSGSIEQVLVLQWTNEGPFEIVRDPSKIDMASSPDQSKYKPDQRIEGTISPIARRRWQRLID
jgi:hypothetical protein